MNQSQVKEILLNIHEAPIEFSITFDAESNRENGMYKQETQVIILFTKKVSDNYLIYNAIHQYAHLLVCYQTPMAKPDEHTPEFNEIFKGLVRIAIKKGIYIDHEAGMLKILGLSSVCILISVAILSSIPWEYWASFFDLLDKAITSLTLWLKSLNIKFFNRYGL